MLLYYTLYASLIDSSAWWLSLHISFSLYPHFNLIERMKKEERCSRNCNGTLHSIQFEKLLKRSLLEPDIYHNYLLRKWEQGGSKLHATLSAPKRQIYSAQFMIRNDSYKTKYETSNCIAPHENTSFFCFNLWHTTNVCIIFTKYDSRSNIHGENGLLLLQRNLWHSLKQQLVNVKLVNDWIAFVIVLTKIKIIVNRSQLVLTSNQFFIVLAHFFRCLEIY